MPTVKVKTPLGMRKSYFAVISSEPESGHPIYGPVLDMGAAVKGYLSVTTASGNIPGDDKILLYEEKFVSAQLDAETTKSDLELNAQVYGHSYSEGLETSGKDDSAPHGGYGFIEPILLSTKQVIYRATFLYKVSAMQSSEKTEADTRKNDFNPKMNAVSFFCLEDNTGNWRDRQEFATEAAADAWIKARFGSKAAFALHIQHIGQGSSAPGAGTVYVTSGENQVVEFPTPPTKLYDNAEDVTASIQSGKYTISAIAADHALVAVWST